MLGRVVEANARDAASVEEGLDGGPQLWVAVPEGRGHAGARLAGRVTGRVGSQLGVGGSGERRIRLVVDGRVRVAPGLLAGVARNG